MKEFWIYNGLRFLVFAGTLVVVIGIWLLIDSDGFDNGGTSMPIALIVAIVVSGVISYWLLARPRKAWAERIEVRATRAKAAFDAHKAKEDED